MSAERDFGGWIYIIFFALFILQMIWEGYKSNKPKSSRNPEGSGSPPKPPQKPTSASRRTGGIRPDLGKSHDQRSQQAKRPGLQVGRKEVRIGELRKPPAPPADTGKASPSATASSPTPKAGSTSGVFSYDDILPSQPPPEKVTSEEAKLARTLPPPLVPDEEKTLVDEESRLARKDLLRSRAFGDAKREDGGEHKETDTLRGTASGKRSQTKRFFSSRQDLIRGVIAKEILERPEERWRKW